MASNPPIVKQITWIAMFPQMFLVALFAFVYWLIGIKDFVIYGAITNLVLAFGLRYFIPKYHRQGMVLVKQKYFAEAIPWFKKSYEFFSRHSWVDKYRFLTLASSSKMCYREIALNNIAFCYGQVGDGDKAIEYYERTLAEYPGNELARAGLNMLRAGIKKG